MHDTRNGRSRIWLTRRRDRPRLVVDARPHLRSTCPETPRVALDVRSGVPSAPDDVETEVAQITRVRTADVMIADHRSTRSIRMRALHDHADHGLSLTGVLQLTVLLHVTNLTARSAIDMRRPMHADSRRPFRRTQ